MRLLLAARIIPLVLVAAVGVAQAETWYSFCLASPKADRHATGTMYITPVFVSETSLWGMHLKEWFLRELESRGYRLDEHGYPRNETFGGCSSKSSSSDAEELRQIYIDGAVNGTKVGNEFRKRVVHLTWQPTAEQIANKVAPAPETAAQRDLRLKREAETARLDAQRKAAADRAAADQAARDAREAERLRLEAERVRQETQARQRREAERGKELQRRALASAAERRKQRALEAAPKNKCMTKETRGTTSEFGGTQAEARERLLRWTNRMCGGKPAVVSNHRCTGRGLIDCTVNYVCPSRPTWCPAGVTRQ